MPIVIAAQCNSCDFFAPSGGTNFNLTGNQKICITANTGNLGINFNGLNNSICVAPGITWTQNNLNIGNGATLDVYGTIVNSNTINTLGGGGNIINIHPTGEIVSQTNKIPSDLVLNNENILTLLSANKINISGNGITVNNLASGVITAPNTINFFLGTDIVVNNEGLVDVANLENEEGYLLNQSGSIFIVQRNFNNHGDFLNEGEFQKLCTTLPGSAGTTSCQFRVGDKGSGKEFINNSCCLNIDGNTLFQGDVTNNGIISIFNGDLEIQKLTTGTNGHISVINGFSETTISGSYAGTNLTFCDSNGPGNHFDLIGGPGPNLYTINCTKISCCPCLNCDFGDLPDTGIGTSTNNFESLQDHFGPSHIVNSQLTIGATIDIELDGQPSANANGDGSDEDGFNFPNNLNLVPSGVINLPINIINNTGTVAHFEIWIDWNYDGDFNDANEFAADISDDGSGNFGVSHISINIPSNAITESPLGFRARLSHTDNMTPYGKLSIGEVEDYFIEVNCKPQICAPIIITPK